jgi:hypothetical protein
MPFDALNRYVDELAMLGIVPVSAEILHRHKQYMIDTATNSVSRWRTHSLMSDHSIGFTGQMIRPKHAIAHQLAHVNRLGLWLPTRANAPLRVRRLAERLHAALPEATFDLGYFYRDPYLMVNYNGGQACLAIWTNRFRLVAIAHQQRRWW